MNLGLTVKEGGGFENLFFRGSLIGLLVLVGIFASPVMGYLSDRYGRKRVLLPGMGVLALLTLLMAFGGDNIVIMTILLGGLGLFLYSDQPILTARGDGYCAGRDGGYDAGLAVHGPVHIQRRLAADCRLAVCAERRL